MITMLFPLSDDFMSMVYVVHFCLYVSSLATLIIDPFGFQNKL